MNLTNCGNLIELPLLLTNTFTIELQSKMNNVIMSFDSGQQHGVVLLHLLDYPYPQKPSSLC